MITLGIIGVVAALTIPGLIANYQKRKTVTQLKETYSIMQQAMKLSQEDNGEVDSWDTTLSGKAFFEKYIQNYVKVMNSYSSGELFKVAPRTNLNGSRYSGTTYTGGNAYHFSLINGAIVSANLNSGNESGLWVGIDVNGISKPNKVGKDTFLFFLSSEYGLQPLGNAGTPASWSIGKVYKRDVVKGSSGSSCAKGKSGYWCAALIVGDNWTIQGDYPWNVK